MQFRYTLAMTQTFSTPWRWFFFFALFYLILYGYNLGQPNEMYYDEVYQVKTAQRMLSLGSYDQTTHPPLGIILIAASLKIFGFYTWASRIPSLLAGLGCLWALFEITQRFTRSKRAATLAVMLMTFDCISFTQARIGMLNATMLCFVLVAILFLMKHTTTNEWSRRRAFIWSGIFFGAALSTRWVAMTAAPVLGVLWIQSFAQSEDKKNFLKDTLVYLLGFGVLAYLAPFIIFPFLEGFSWKSIIQFHFAMWKYNITLKAGHNYASDWWTWPFMSRPIWYSFFRAGEGAWPIQGILCIGNPLIFWLIPMTMGYAIYQFWKERTVLWIFILVGFFSQWLPWAFVSRVKFFHYFQTALPFLCIAMAVGLDWLYESGREGRWVVIGYLAAATIMFFYWLPLLNNFPISEMYYQGHLWFRSWV